MKCKFFVLAVFNRYFNYGNYEVIKQYFPCVTSSCFSIRDTDIIINIFVFFLKLIQIEIVAWSRSKRNCIFDWAQINWFTIFKTTLFKVGNTKHFIQQSIYCASIDFWNYDVENLICEILKNFLLFDESNRNVANFWRWRYHFSFWLLLRGNIHSDV